MSRAVRAHLPRPSVRLAGVMAAPQSSTIPFRAEGPLPVPSPWHLVQFASNSSRPRVTDCRVGAGSAAIAIGFPGPPPRGPPPRPLPPEGPHPRRRVPRPSGQRLPPPSTGAPPSEVEVSAEPHGVVRHVGASRRDALDGPPPVGELQQPGEPAV